MKYLVPIQAKKIATKDGITFQSYRTIVDNKIMYVSFVKGCAPPEEDGYIVVFAGNVAYKNGVLRLYVEQCKYIKPLDGDIKQMFDDLQPKEDTLAGLFVEYDED